MQSLRTTRSLPMLFAVVVAAAVGLLIVSLRNVDAAESAVEVSDSSATTAADISCDVDTAVYGDDVSCTANGGSAIQWPDGKSTSLDATHIPAAVGEAMVAVIDVDGVILASTALSITPDIAVECVPRDGDPKKVFELADSETRNGWDYVFIDVASGKRVSPGDSRHPNGGAEDGLERILLSEVQPTGLCRLTSNAAEDHDGEYQLSVESPWEATQTTPMKIIGPSSKTQWAGAQPAEVEGVVIVNGLTASERVGVYQSGCS